MKKLLNLRQDIIRNGLLLSKHAECAVIEQFISKSQILQNKGQKIRNLNLVVIRIDSQQRLVDSTPCTECAKKMKLFGLKKVTYSNSSGKIVCSKLDDIHEHESAGQRCIQRTLETIEILLQRLQN